LRRDNICGIALATARLEKPMTLRRGGNECLTIGETNRRRIHVSCIRRVKVESVRTVAGTCSAPWTPHQPLAVPVQGEA